MNKYDSVKIVGQGSYGKALLCKRKKDSKFCIIKQISLAKMSRKEAALTEQEANLLKRLNHPNIVAFWESFSSNQNLYIVMEYADGGDLEFFIKKYSKQNSTREIPEGQVINIFLQLCLALKHVHDRKILHRDIKTQNVFLTSSGLCKLGDFGVSRIMRHTVELASTQIGTPYYMSPEIMKNQKYNSKTDIWSMGVILYELMCLKLPFQGNSMKQLCYNILNANPAPPSPKYSKDLRDLMKEVLLKNPKCRPSINSILSKPIMKNRISNFLGETKLNHEFSHTILHGVDIMRSNVEQKLMLKPTPKVEQEKAVIGLSKPQGIPPPPTRNAPVPPPQHIEPSVPAKNRVENKASDIQNLREMRNQQNKMELARIEAFRQREKELEAQRRKIIQMNRERLKIFREAPKPKPIDRNEGKKNIYHRPPMKPPIPIFKRPSSAATPSESNPFQEVVQGKKLGIIESMNQKKDKSIDPPAESPNAISVSHAPKPSVIREPKVLVSSKNQHRIDDKRGPERSSPSTDIVQDAMNKAKNILELVKKEKERINGIRSPVEDSDKPKNLPSSDLEVLRIQDIAEIEDSSSSSEPSPLLEKDKIPEREIHNLVLKEPTQNKEQNTPSPLVDNLSPWFDDLKHQMGELKSQVNKMQIAKSSPNLRQSPSPAPVNDKPQVNLPEKSYVENNIAMKRQAPRISYPVVESTRNRHQYPPKQKKDNLVKNNGGLNILAGNEVKQYKPKPVNRRVSESNVPNTAKTPANSKAKKKKEQPVSADSIKEKLEDRKMKREKHQQGLRDFLKAQRNAKKQKDELLNENLISDIAEDEPKPAISQIDNEFVANEESEDYFAPPESHIVAKEIDADLPIEASPIPFSEEPTPRLFSTFKNSKQNNWSHESSQSENSIANGLAHSILVSHPNQEIGFKQPIKSSKGNHSKPLIKEPSQIHQSNSFNVDEYREIKQRERGKMIKAMKMKHQESSYRSPLTPTVDADLNKPSRSAKGRDFDIEILSPPEKPPPPSFYVVNDENPITPREIPSENLDESPSKTVDKIPPTFFTDSETKNQSPIKYEPPEDLVTDSNVNCCAMISNYFNLRDEKIIPVTPNKVDARRVFAEIDLEEKTPIAKHDSISHEAYNDEDEQEPPTHYTYETISKEGEMEENMSQSDGLDDSLKVNFAESQFVYVPSTEERSDPNNMDESLHNSSKALGHSTYFLGKSFIDQMKANHDETDEDELIHYEMDPEYSILVAQMQDILNLPSKQNSSTKTSTKPAMTQLIEPKKDFIEDFSIDSIDINACNEDEEIYADEANLPEDDDEFGEEDEPFRDLEQNIEEQDEDLFDMIDEDPDKLEAIVVEEEESFSLANENTAAPEKVDCDSYPIDNANPHYDSFDGDVSYAPKNESTLFSVSRTDRLNQNELSEGHSKENIRKNLNTDVSPSRFNDTTEDDFKGIHEQFKLNNASMIDKELQEDLDQRKELDNDLNSHVNDSYEKPLVDVDQQREDDLKEYLIEKLGFDALSKALTFLNNIQYLDESTDDEELLAELETVAGEKSLYYLDDMFQLLTMESTNT